MKQRYLLDSNICIHFLRNRQEVLEGIERVGWSACAVSDITAIELLYGAECSAKREENIQAVMDFLNDIDIIPLRKCINEFCKQKAEMRRRGTMIEDFDLFIGTTAVALNMIMVSENIKHLERIQGIHIENWIKR